MDALKLLHKRYNFKNNIHSQSVIDIINWKSV